MTQTITNQANLDLAQLDVYRRATNFLAAAQIYLKDNCLLEEPLRPEHIKDRLLGLLLKFGFAYSLAHSNP